MKWFPIYLPPILLIAACAAVNLLPEDQAWAGHTVIGITPYIITTAIAILGIFFNMSRLASVSLLLCLAYAYIGHIGFSAAAQSKAVTVSFFTSIYLPPSIAIIHRMNESGIFNMRGIIKPAIVLTAFLGIIIFSSLPAAVRGISSASSLWFTPPFNWMPFSGLAMAVIACSAPFILVRKKLESPILGIITAEALIIFMIGANSSHLDWNGRNCSAFALLTCTGMICLLIGSFENMWRHINIDELTELPNRRSLKSTLARLSDEYSIALVDVDHFKKINDTYGHKCGDDVLRFLASILRNATNGKAYRYGGEEFIIVMDKTKLKDALAWMENLREFIHEKPFYIRAPRPILGRKKRGKADKESEAINISVSIGLAKNRNASDDPNDVISAADKALYKSKAEGRNRTTMASWA